MKFKNNPFSGLRNFLLLWSTQSLSALGSAMTGFALVIYCYERTQSAMTTALLSVCSYAPYVLLSMFAGAMGDRFDKKKIMLLCDSFAALTTIAVLALFLTGRLVYWHLYVINALNGLMNTLQQPASDVAATLLTPEDKYQKIGGFRAFSNSLITILSPVLATSLFSFFGLEAVIYFDLFTFAVAFFTLAFCISIPKAETSRSESDTMLLSVRQGLSWLSENKGILYLVLFLAAINLTASIYNAALPAMLLSRKGGGKAALGLVNASTGFAMLAGSIAAALLPAPKNRVRIICASLFFAMSTENFILAFGRSTPVWCFGAILGWLMIPVMNTNMDALMRSCIPVGMQGRVYAARNSLQFFTIPVGYMLGGWLVDYIAEPFMGRQSPGSPLTVLFGAGKGSGCAILFFFLGFLGCFTCVVFARNRHIRALGGK